LGTSGTPVVLCFINIYHHYVTYTNRHKSTNGFVPVLFVCNRKEAYVMSDFVVQKGSMETTIISNESGTRVYEICRELSGAMDGHEECILITLYPTLNDVGKLDQCTYHFLNHAKDMGVTKVRSLYLFSRVVSARMSTRGLEVDEENMAYVEEVLKSCKDAKVVIGWGSSMKTSKAANLSKERIVELFRKYRKGENLYQIGAEGIICEDNYHPLYMGICCDNLPWRLITYTFTGGEESEQEKKNVKKSVRKPTKKGGK